MNQNNFLQRLDALARERGMDKNRIIEQLEKALIQAAQRRFDAEGDFTLTIDRETGEIRAFEDDKPVELEKLGRIVANVTKQVFGQSLKETERDQVFDEWTTREHSIVSGTIIREEFGLFVVSLGRAEAILPREEQIPGEIYRIGRVIRAYVLTVAKKGARVRIVLSRTHGNFVRELFKAEIPEVADGLIEIKGIVREPGRRTKIAVQSNDPRIDPVGSCVGMRGSRVQAVVQELQGEKVDIIPWSSDTANFIVNALAPAEVSKVLMDEAKNKTEVVVPDDQLSLAIGRRGQNVKLASQLTGWEIDIMTETEESERRQKETRERTELFKLALDVDDVIAHLLVAEGYGSVEDVSETAVEDLATVEGFDEEIATELQRRAREFIEKRDAELASRLADLGVSEEVQAVEGLNLAMIVALGDKGVKTLDDLADLASDELREIVGESAMDNDTANAIIMKAREHWFADEAAPAAEAAKA